MTPQNMLQNSIEAIKKRDYSDFVEITYKGETYLAKVEDGKAKHFEETEDTQTVSISHKKTFLDINLPNGIDRSHIMSYDGEDWSVVDFQKKFVSLYDVFVTKTSRTGIKAKSRI